MSTAPPPPGAYSPQDFLRFRTFLRFLAEAGLDRRLSRSHDPSDIVQTVLLKATEAHRGLKAQSDREVAAWLRKILVNTLATVHAMHVREEQKLGTRISIEQCIEEASTSVHSWISDRFRSPLTQLETEEAMILLALALEKLPELHREVVVLKHWRKWPIESIARHLGRSKASVAGLFRRGIERLAAELTRN